MFKLGIGGSVSVKIVSFISILVTAGVFYPTGVMAVTLMSDDFGTGSAISDVAG